MVGMNPKLIYGEIWLVIRVDCVEETVFSLKKKTNGIVRNHIWNLIADAIINVWYSHDIVCKDRWVDIVCRDKWMVLKFS